MKYIKPFSLSIRKANVIKSFFNVLNKEIDNKVLTKNND